MAVNITLTGKVYDKDDVITNNDVRYQGYFYANEQGGSSSAWSNTSRIVEIDGSYNINLGDSDWLTPGGTANDNSKVILVFWKPSGITDRNSLSLTEWSAYEVTLAGGAATYIQDIQIKDNINPIPVISLPTNGTINESTSMSNGSYDYHNWTSHSGNMSHWSTRYSQDINLINVIDHTDMYWGDGSHTSGIAGAGNSTHVYTDINDFIGSGTVVDKANGSAIGTDTIRIKYHTPSLDITWSPYSPDINSGVIFSNNSTDIDTRITSGDWHIYDDANSLWVSGVTSGYQPVHTFATNGSRRVDMTMYWNDGWNDQTTVRTEYVTVVNIDPSSNFSTVSSGVSATAFEWTSSSTDEDGTIAGYNWGLYSLSPSSLIGSSSSSSYNYTFATSGDYKIELIATDVDGGTDKKTTEFTVTIIDGAVTIVDIEEMRYYTDENIIVARTFTTGDTVNISVYDVNVSGWLNLDPSGCDEISAGIFSFDLTSSYSGIIDRGNYLYSMTNGTTDRNGNIIVSIPDPTIDTIVSSGTESGWDNVSDISTIQSTLISVSGDIDSLNDISITQVVSSGNAQGWNAVSGAIDATELDDAQDNLYNRIIDHGDVQWKNSLAGMGVSPEFVKPTTTKFGVRRSR